MENPQTIVWKEGPWKCTPPALNVYLCSNTIWTQGAEIWGSHTLKNGSNVIRFYHPRSSKLITLKLLEELFKEIQNYEQKVKNSKAGYKIKMRTTFKNKRAKGHFLFYFEKKTIFRRFISGFNNKVPNFSYLTTEIRAAAKFNQVEF